MKAITTERECNGNDSCVRYDVRKYFRNGMVLQRARINANTTTELRTAKKKDRTGQDSICNGIELTLKDR